MIQRVHMQVVTTRSFIIINFTLPAQAGLWAA
jgi:hypothetical protein